MLSHDLFCRMEIKNKVVRTHAAAGGGADWFLDLSTFLYLNAP